MVFFDFALLNELLKALVKLVVANFGVLVSPPLHKIN